MRKQQWENNVSKHNRETSSALYITLKSARRAHGASANNDEPAMAGLFNTFIHTVSDKQLNDLIRNSARIWKNVILDILSETVNSFNSSSAETRCLMALYRNGILSKSKYEGIHRCLNKQYAPDCNRTRWLQLIPGVRMTKTLSYKQVIAAVKKENVGELQPLPVVGDVTIKGFCWPLKALVQMVAELFLSNKRLHASLKWFPRPKKFVYAIGGDGASIGRGDPHMTI